MPKTYTLADVGTLAIVRSVLQRYHQPLDAADVTVGVLMVRGGLQLHGYPALALVRVTALKDRALGLPDCQVQLNDDPDGWESWGQAHRDAIVDHELTHLVLLKDEEGHLKHDDLGRPRLKLRPHDLEIGAFREVIKRHGDQAAEAQAIFSAQKFIQGVFQF